MILEKKTILSPILQSAEGIHLTAYLANSGELEDLKTQLSEVIAKAREYLLPVQSPDETKKFLEPLESLLADARLLKQMKDNIGLFRNSSSFRILNIPVPVENECHVANSFHIKPLLRWMQVDHDFLIMGLNRESLALYSGSQTQLYKVATVSMPDIFKQTYTTQLSRFKKSSRLVRQDREAFFKWLAQWFSQKTQNTNLKLFLVGDRFLIDGFLKANSYQNVVKTPVLYYFDESNVHEIANCVRKVLKDEARKILEKSLLEFRFAEDENRTKKNIFQIAKAAVEGRIKKLIVADGINIFGKIDKKTGGLAIHPFDLDHEDDDILDDLAQTVMENGGEVVVASRQEIPKGRTVLAILNEEENLTDKNQELKNKEILSERL